MAPYLQLDLNSITIDVQLARRVPYALSRYYMALPPGRDNGRNHPIFIIKPPELPDRSTI